MKQQNRNTEPCKWCGYRLQDVDRYAEHLVRCHGDFSKAKKNGTFTLLPN